MKQIKFRAWNGGIMRFMEEGDILIQYQGYEYESEPRSVGWDEEHCGWWFILKGEPHLSLGTYRENLAVIGNIYENPELTKKETNNG